MDKLKRQAIRFFENEIYHYKIMLGGILEDDYRKHLNDKVQYYNLAISSIKNSEQKESNMKKIKIKYFTDIEPLEKISQGDWIDLRSAEDIVLRPGEYKLIPLGIAMQLPKGYEAHVVPRSSTFKNFGVLQVNSCGIIDQSYCGDNDQWMFPALAMRDTEIKKNDRICQFRIVEKMPDIKFVTVDKLENADRGGIGSTGK